MNKKTLYLVIIVALVLSHVVLLSIPFMRDHAKDHPKRVLIDRLDLTEKQIDSYEVLIESHRKQVGSLNNKVLDQRKKLYQEIKSKTVNLLAADSIAILQRKIELEHLGHFQSIRELCSEDQKKIFDSLSKELPILFQKVKRK